MLKLICKAWWSNVLLCRCPKSEVNLKICKVEYKHYYTLKFSIGEKLKCLSQSKNRLVVVIRQTFAQREEFLFLADLLLHQAVKHVCVGFFPIWVGEVKNKRRRCNKLKDNFSLNVLPPYFQQQRLKRGLSSEGTAEPWTFFLVIGKWGLFLSFSFVLNKPTGIQAVIP